MFRTKSLIASAAALSLCLLVGGQVPLTGAGKAVSTPGCVPSTALNFNFTTGSAPVGVTLASSANGTFVNSSGFIAGAGTSGRFTYISGTPYLLYEPAATNLWSFSQAPSSWLNQFSSLVTETDNAATGPDNTSSAATFVFSGAGYFYGQFATSTIGNYTGSSYIKTSTGTGAMRISNDAGSQGTGSAFSNTASFVRNIISINFTGTIAQVDWGTDNRALAGADGAAKTVTLAATQLEATSYATSYIPNLSTGTKTRTADTATFNIPSCVGHLTVTFSDNTTQSLVVTPGATGYVLTNPLNEFNVKTIVGAA